MRWMRASILGITAVALSVVGHAAGGGHLDPVLVLLLTAGVTVAAFGWLHEQRNLMAIIAAVLMVQVASHVVLSVGHVVLPSPGMGLTHLASALMLSVFLRWGEARVFECARRNYLRLLMASRMAQAGLLARPVPDFSAHAPVHVPRSAWIPAGVDGRGPPLGA